MQILITVAALSNNKASTLFARPNTGVVGANSTQGIHGICLRAFILCLCSPGLLVAALQRADLPSKNPTDSVYNYETKTSGQDPKTEL
jgi:hypothetical protein